MRLKMGKMFVLNHRHHINDVAGQTGKGLVMSMAMMAFAARSGCCTDPNRNQGFRDARR
jgi:hypothetical protein